MAPVPRNRFTMTMMAIVFALYAVWIVLALVVVGPLIVVFLPVLLLPALLLPIFATHYVPMITARAVEGLEFCLGIGVNAPLQVRDVVEAVKDPSADYDKREPALARVTRVHPGFLYRLVQGDRYDVELTDEVAVSVWSSNPSENEVPECIVN